MANEEQVLDDLDLSLTEPAAVKKPAVAPVQVQDKTKLPEKAPSFTNTKPVAPQIKIVTKYKSKKSKLSTILTLSSIVLSVVVLFVGIIFLVK